MNYTRWSSGPAPNYWTSHPILNAYVNLKIAGGFNRSTLTWLKEDIFNDLAPLPDIASIACGSGAAERQALAVDLADNVTGYDFSEASLVFARKKAAEDGWLNRFKYVKYDFNSQHMPNNGKLYPLILIFGGLHHAENLDFFINDLKRVLARNGIIFFNEYIGPNRFQYHSEHCKILNQVIASIPKSLRVVDEYLPEDPQLLAKNDPSEAVHSEDIMFKIKENFFILDQCDYGGSLLFPLWSSVLVREEFMNLRQKLNLQLLKNVMFLEEILTNSGVLPSLFSQCLICRKEEANNLNILSKKLNSDLRIRRPAVMLSTADMRQFYWPRLSPARVAREKAISIFKKINLL